MKKILLAVVILLFLFGGVASFAQGAELPAPGLTPDSPFYFLKSWKESIQIFFTFGAENKAKQFLHLAEVRLAEYQKMIEAGKIEIAVRTFEKYEKQLGQAVEKANQAVKEGKDDGRLAEEVRQEKIKHQEVLKNTAEKMPEETKAEFAEDRRAKWMEFISEAQKKFPEAISHPIESTSSLPANLLLNCQIPVVPSPADCDVKWLFNSADGCPYFSCPSTNKYEQTQTAPPSKRLESENPFGSATPVSEKICAQVITPAIGPGNVCREFPTPCDVPPDWTRIDKCPSTAVKPECNFGQEKYHPCPNDKEGDLGALWCTCTREGKWNCVPNPESKCPVISEFRYYTCPDGTKVESGRCFAGGVCAISVSPERQCPQMTTPVTRGTVCGTAGEIKYFKCSNGTEIPWCMCGPEGSFAGAKNKWQCQYYPVGFTCQKTAVTPAPAPAPTEPMIACCLSDGNCVYETKEHCLLKKGAPASTCSPNSCPVPTPAPAPVYNECAPGEKKNYQCPDGTPMPWCGCDSTGKWSCGWDERQIGGFCPFSVSGPPVISNVTVRDSAYDPFAKEVSPPVVKEIVWSTNETANCTVEYGQTASYGSTTPLANVAEFRRVTHMVKLTGLSANTIYHYRITAKDTEGNATVSDDYIFTTGQ